MPPTSHTTTPREQSIQFVIPPSQKPTTVPSPSVVIVIPVIVVVEVEWEFAVIISLLAMVVGVGVGIWDVRAAGGAAGGVAGRETVIEWLEVGFCEGKAARTGRVGGGFEGVL